MTARRLARLVSVGACALGLLAAPSAQADIRVEIEGVEAELLANVRIFLSLTRYATLDDLSEDLVNRLQQRAPAEVADALRPLGYYAPEVEGTLTRDGRDWVSRLVIRPGAPVILTDVDVTIEGAGRDESFLRAALDEGALAPGQRLHHGVYENVKGELQRRAASNGYLDARYEIAELVVDPAARTAVARLKLVTGERYRFGATTIEQDVLDPRYAARFLRYRAGEWYSTGALLRTQFALDDTAYFGVVEVLPGDRDPATRTVPVRIQASANERNRYTVGVGYETDFGARVRLGWENRRVNRRGHRLRFESSVAQDNQSGSLRYVVPIGDPALEKVELDLTGQNSELADARSRSLTLRPSLTRVLGRWQRVGFVEVSRSESIAGVQRTIDTRVVPGVSFAPLPRGVLVDGPAENQGFYAELIGSQRALGSRSNFLRARVRNDWRWEVAPRWSVLARGELGATAVKNFDQFPVQYRFFAGGDRSVRGFAFNSLSPRETVAGVDLQRGTGDDQELRTGGKHLLVASLELERALPRNFAVAVFADAGNAFNRFDDPLEYSAGLGVRYRLPFVSIGIDVAKPLSQDGNPRFHLNVTPVF
ncbi:MAG: autotransporter assembly complex protein TamA [Pseudomonadota bacterium]